MNSLEAVTDGTALQHSPIALATQDHLLWTKVAANTKCEFRLSRVDSLGCHKGNRFAGEVDLGGKIVEVVQFVMLG